MKTAALLLGALLVTARMGAGEAVAPLPEGLYAEISTPRGAITCELFFTRTPLTVANFVGLAEGTLGPAPRKPFFNGLAFHRVVPDFVIQGGDPLNNGEGGPGYRFPDEFVPGLRHDAAGVLSMANDGPDTNGSQFFITLREVNRLNYLHSVFGRVVRGLDVLPRVAQGDVMTVKILRVGPAAAQFRADEAAFRTLEAKVRPYASLASARPEPGPTAHVDDPDHLLPIDPPRARNFNFKLANFERTTGVRLVVRLFAKSPSAAEDAKAGEYMSKLGARLGTDHRGALIAYFADEKDWRVWIGGEETSAFFGRTTSPSDLVEGGPFHHAKEAFLQQAQQRGDDDYAQQRKTAKPDHPLPPGQNVKLQLDAIIDGLIDRLEKR